MNETGRKIKEHYVDTGRFTDHLFAITSLLAFRFIPRHRDLPSKRLYLFGPASAPKKLRSLIGGKIREGLIVQNWPDILRPWPRWRRASCRPVSCSKSSRLIPASTSWPWEHAVRTGNLGFVNFCG